MKNINYNKPITNEKNEKNNNLYNLYNFPDTYLNNMYLS